MLLIFCSSLDIVCEKSFPNDFYYMDDIIISGDGIDKLTANFDDKGWDVMILDLVTRKNELCLDFRKVTGARCRTYKF